MKALIALAVVVILHGPFIANAQNKNSVRRQLADVRAQVEEQSTASAIRMTDFEKKLEAQEQRIADLEAQGKSKEEEVKQLQAELEEVKSEQEMMALEDLEEGIESQGRSGKLFSYWGFFDLTFHKYFFPDDSIYHIFLDNNPTFLMTSINLYFMSQMTDNLGALVETQLTYLPHGLETDWGTRIGTTTIGEYTRIDSQVQHPYTSEYYRQHGLHIVRVQLKYTPTDWFNVIAGRFLTPYGIWNTDHGSPVVMTIRVPYMQIRKMMPLVQTGLQAYGRFFPLDNLYFNYAITVSNGRGPLDELYDLDANKGVGLLLRLEYEGDDSRISAGGYGYYGKYTDRSKTIELHLNDLGQLDGTMDRPITVDLQTTIENDEVVASADLLLELFGLRLQGEFIWRRVDYAVPAVLNQTEHLFAGGTPGEMFYHANHTGYAVYGLLAYELPLHRWLDPVRISPYVFYERNRHADVKPSENMTLYIAGLNIKPSPYVTIKLEGGFADLEHRFYGSRLKDLAVQMAVSF